MKLCYQMATPDVRPSFSVTAYQGPLEQSLAELSDCGYDGVEIMARNLSEIDRPRFEKLLQCYGLIVPIVCSGEIFGQGGLNLGDPAPDIRALAEQRLRETIDFAASLGAGVNIGRVRGNYRDDTPFVQTRRLVIDAIRRLADYAGARQVFLALEPITVLQTRFINTVSQAAAFAEEVDHPAFGYMMDLYHMNIEEKDLIAAIHRHGGKCLHVHLADNNRMYPGSCALDFPRIIQAFHDSGYQRVFSTEIWQLPDQQTAARETARFLTPLLSDIYGRRARP